MGKLLVVGVEQLRREVASRSTKIHRWSDGRGPVSKARNPARLIVSVTRDEHARKSIWWEPRLYVAGGIS